jgi:hypothetical protein
MRSRHPAPCASAERLCALLRLPPRMAATPTARRRPVHGECRPQHKRLSGGLLPGLGPRLHCFRAPAAEVCLYTLRACTLRLLTFLTPLPPPPTLLVMTPTNCRSSSCALSR